MTAFVGSIVRQVTVGLIVLLLAVEICVVTLRYVFGLGFIELQDLGLYAFGALILLAIPYALTRDSHVRVDILRNVYGPRWRRVIECGGVLLLLLPVFAVTMWYVWPDIRFSWSIREGSVETGGLPGLFLVKTVLPVACLLMIVIGLDILRRNLRPDAGDDPAQS